MDPKLLRYYKKKMHGGRTLVARAIDFVMLRAFLFFVIFVIVLYLSLSTTVALLISIFLTAAVSLAAFAWDRRKVEKYITKDMLRIKQKCLLEKLTFMDIRAYADYLNDIYGGNITDVALLDDGFTGTYKGAGFYAFHNHPDGECTVGDALKIYRLFENKEKFIIVSLSEFCGDAQSMLAAAPKSIELINGKSVLKMAQSKGMLPDEAEAEEQAIKEMNATIVTLENLKESAFSKTKIKGYIICGIVIMCWPLVTGFRIYYPIIAIACFAMAIITYKKSKQHDEGADLEAPRKS